MPTEKNNIQDVEIGKLKVQITKFEERFNRFMSNDFHDLRGKVESIESKILWGFIAMIASTIIIQIILSLFK